MDMKLRDWGALLLLSFLWGGSFFLVAVALRDVPPLTLVLARVVVGAAALGVYLRWSGIALPRQRRVIASLALMGLINNTIPFILLFWAQTQISSSLASILNSTTPLFSMVVAHLALSDERMSAGKLLGVIFGVIGVAVLIGGMGAPLSSGAMWGAVACLGAALAYGIASVFGRRFSAWGIDPAVGAFGQLAASSVIILPFAIAIDRPWQVPLPGLPSIAAILVLGVVSTSLAYLLYFRLLENAGAVNAVLVTLLVPVTAIILGTVFLGEALALRHYIGMGIILVGLLAIDGRVFRTSLPRLRKG